jgi:uncharacterized damage-inducible protein DinB
MNTFMQQHGDIYRETLALRPQLMDILTDADLIFTPGGSNPTLGALLRETGDIERSYIDSLKTHKQDWATRTSDPALETSVDKLKAWFTALDDELMTVMEGLTDDDLQQSIERGFTTSVGTQLHIYREAVLIFGGRISVYVKAMGKPMPQQWVWWIG